MSKKIRTTIYLDPDILKEAQELGLNISKTCENALKIVTKQLRPIYNQNKPIKNVENNSQKQMASPMVSDH